MSNDIVKYENFLMDKNENINNIDNVHTPKEKEEACIWKFLN